MWLTIAVVLGLAGPAVAQGEALSQGGVLRRVDGTRFELLDRHGGAGFGFRGAFVVDAITYALGLAVLPIVRLKPPEPHPDDGADEGAEPKGSIREAMAGNICRCGCYQRIENAVHLASTGV